MTVYEKYPIINKIMLTHLHETAPYLDCRDDPYYAKVGADIEATFEKLKAEAVHDGALQKDTLDELENLYGSQESTADDYAFFEGFMACTQLMFEMMALREEMLHSKDK